MDGDFVVSVHRQNGEGTEGGTVRPGKSSFWVKPASHPVVQLVTRVEMLAGGRLLALGDEGGGVSVADLRMLGASTQGTPSAHTLTIRSHCPVSRIAATNSLTPTLALNADHPY